MYQYTESISQTQTSTNVKKAWDNYYSYNESVVVIKITAKKAIMYIIYNNNNSNSCSSTIWATESNQEKVGRKVWWLRMKKKENKIQNTAK